jgi:hypothetical protein
LSIETPRKSLTAGNNHWNKVPTNSQHNKQWNTCQEGVAQSTSLAKRTKFDPHCKGTTTAFLFARTISSNVVAFGSSHCHNNNNILARAWACCKDPDTICAKQSMPRTTQTSLALTFQVESTFDVHGDLHDT